MRGLEVIDEAKARLEMECPGIVSCADIIVYAARDSAVLSGVPSFKTRGGRRDSLVSRLYDVDLPSPTFPIDQLVAAFTRKGMTRDHLVVLTGAHSIGLVHCSMFAYRAMGYNKTIPIDPKLVEEDRLKILSNCQGQDLGQTVLPIDSETDTLMDNRFYKKLLKGSGLLESDCAMAVDPKTRRIVNKMAKDERRWLRAFAKAMVRLGEIEVKTGTEGEIRKDCRSVN